MSWLHAAFDSVSDAQDALEQLAEAGVDASEIEVRSSIPLVHEVCPVGLEVRSRVPLMAVVGGLTGATVAFLLVSLSSQAYPLPTGGMPIVPPADGWCDHFRGPRAGSDPVHRGHRALRMPASSPGRGVGSARPPSCLREHHRRGEVGRGGV